MQLSHDKGIVRASACLRVPVLVLVLVLVLELPLLIREGGAHMEAKIPAEVIKKYMLCERFTFIYIFTHRL